MISWKLIQKAKGILEKERALSKKDGARKLRFVSSIPTLTMWDVQPRVSDLYQI